MFGLPKLYLHIAAAVLVCGLAYKAVDSYGDRREAKVVARYDEALAKEKTRIEAAEKASDLISRSKEIDYQAKIDSLQTRVDAIQPSPNGIRLCRQPADTSSTASIASAASEPTEAASGDGSGVRAGPDIERTLVQFAERAETDRLTVVAWQELYAAQSAEWVR